jgi:hypothetical protein
MEDRRIFRRLIPWAVALALAAIAAPMAEARHAPAEAELSTSPSGPVDAATRHHHPDVAQPLTRVIAVTRAGGFDWADAGIGAGGALGAVLLAGGSVLLVKRTHRRAIPARFES